MGISISGGVKIPQGKFSVYTPVSAAGKSLWGWGSGGSIGNGTAIDKSSPVQIGALIDWAIISGQSGHILALKTDGTLWSWGNGGSGRLGDGTVISKSSPVQVGLLSDWANVSGGDAHSLAVKTDGTLGLGQRRLWSNWIWRYCCSIISCSSWIFN